MDLHRYRRISEGILKTYGVTQQAEKAREPLEDKV
jgi:hypothetical protein